MYNNDNNVIMHNVYNHHRSYDNNDHLYDNNDNNRNICLRLEPQPHQVHQLWQWRNRKIVRHGSKGSRFQYTGQQVKGMVY